MGILCLPAPAPLGSRGLPKFRRFAHLAPRMREGFGVKPSNTGPKIDNPEAKWYAFGLIAAYAERDVDGARAIETRIADDEVNRLRALTILQMMAADIALKVRAAGGGPEPVVMREQVIGLTGQVLPVEDELNVVALFEAVWNGGPLPEGEIADKERIDCHVLAAGLAMLGEAVIQPPGSFTPGIKMMANMAAEAFRRGSGS